MVMRRHMPSARSLLVFEAAARLGNFSQAAEELNVTQPAVSHAVSTLEKHLEQKLFVRTGPKLTLTEHGERLSQAASRAFDDIEGVINEIRSPQEDREIVMLSLSTGLVTHWLLPRYDRFRNEFPQLDLQFQLLPGSVGGPLNSCDLGLRVAAGKDRLQISGWFAPERVLAVGTPGYLRDHGPLQAAYARHTLISLRRVDYGWPDFLASVGQGDLGPFEHLSFPDYAVVLQAAIGGQGLALGWTSVVSRLIIDESLVPATDAVIDSDRSYHLVTSGQRAIRSSVVAVRDWLIAEMEDEERRMQEMFRDVPHFQMTYS